MKILLTFFFTCLFSLLYSQQSDFAKNQLIAELKSFPNTNAISTFSENQRLAAINDSLGLESVEIIGNKKIARTLLLKFSNDIDVLAAQKIYHNTLMFEYVEPNFIGKGHGVLQTTPNDPLFLLRQWSHVNAGGFTLSPASVDADIDTDLAWDITQGSPDLTVAILDSGLKMNHPEFDGRMVAGFDFANNDDDPSDDHGHGTNVAGIALATGNNAIGYAGVNWNSKVMICKVLDHQNSGFYSWWANAIYFAVDNGADVINLSAGGFNASTVLENAVNYAYDHNVSVVVSTGNQNSAVQYPAKYVNVIAVGSTNPNDVRSQPFFWDSASGSNFGPEVDFVAPGNYIYGLHHLSDSNYNSFWGGTSQAAPHVAGVISLLLSMKPMLTVDEIRLVLQQTSEDQIGDSFDVAGWDQYYGHGRINAFSALTHPLLATTEYLVESINIKAYPNPIENDQALMISGLEADNNYNIQLISLDGKIVQKMEQKTSDGKLLLNAGALQAGTYFVRINHLDNKLTFVKKIIKQ
ncbi:MAG TPA: S8 family peptidase [Flavobacterium sp.]|jgi:subtilisin family serine protease|nr:S8 family peptidase [Flavobacterium sp.]